MITIEQFLNVVSALRNPEKGCPWDIKQTFDSMVPCLLEETYEVAEAIHTKDKRALREELGDLLLQVIFLSQLAKEEGSFTFQDVLTDIHDKLIYRHPHVFGDKTAQNSEEALQNWEAQKANETKRKENRKILFWMIFLSHYPLSLGRINYKSAVRKSALIGKIPTMFI